MKKFQTEQSSATKAFEYKNIQNSFSNSSWNNLKSNSVKSSKKSMGILYYNFHGEIKFFDESVSNQRGNVINLHI